MRKIAFVAAAAILAALATDTTAQTVVRGSAPSVQEPGLPTVLRGAGAKAEPARAAPQAPLYAVGGNTLWLIDDSGGLAACALRASGYAGRNTIACANATISY